MIINVGAAHCSAHRIFVGCGCNRGIRIFVNQYVGAGQWTAPTY